MGVTYYNCDNCGDIFNSYTFGGFCDHCDSRWCADCKNSIQRFLFANEERCTQCFDTVPDVPTENEVLTFALGKLGMTRAELIQEFVTNAGPDSRFHSSSDEYRCTQCPAGTCASTQCEQIDQDYERPNEDDEIPARGYCCVAQEEPHAEFCAPCQAFWCRKTIMTLLGIRAFRPESPLTALQRDVLRDIVIKQFILPHAKRYFCVTKEKAQMKRRKHANK